VGERLEDGGAVLQVLGAFGPKLSDRTAGLGIYDGKGFSCHGEAMLKEI
jgi:hypothetical protein